MLLLAEGVSARAVETKLEVSRPTRAKWRRRYLEHGVEGLTNRHRGRPRWTLAVRLRAGVLADTRGPPAGGTTQWSCRRVAAHLGVDKNIVPRVWREADLRLWIWEAGLEKAWRGSSWAQPWTLGRWRPTRSTGRAASAQATAVPRFGAERRPPRHRPFGLAVVDPRGRSGPHGLGVVPQSR